MMSWSPNQLSDTAPSPARLGGVGWTVEALRVVPAARMVHFWNSEFAGGGLARCALLEAPESHTRASCAFGQGSERTGKGAF